MTIIGKSRAALAMICDALYHKRLDYDFFLFNNLGIDGNFSYHGFHIQEITELHEDSTYILGAVVPKTKRALVNFFPKIDFSGVIHPKAFVSTNCEIGAGVLIDSNASVASGAVLGSYVTVYANSSIAHDSVLGSYVTICPNVAVCGNVNIGEGTFIGAGSVIKNGVTIGRDCVIGCGSVVLNDVPDGKIVYGSPAKEKVNV